MSTTQKILLFVSELVNEKSYKQNISDHLYFKLDLLRPITVNVVC